MGVLRGLLLLALALGCNRDPGVQAPLTADERLLVDLYVQVALLENALSRGKPWAQGRIDSLATAVDSLAVQRALRQLHADPRRWEVVYDTLAARLAELEQAPQSWWAAPGGAAPPRWSGEDSSRILSP